MGIAYAVLFALQVPTTAVLPAERPAILFNRWEEDWSVLADRRVPSGPLDDLKYIPLSRHDPKVYLSLGADERERFEANDAANFGTGRNRSQDYVLSRLELHADLRLGAHVQVFTQLQSDFAPGKTITPVDQDRLDLEQAFVGVAESVGGGALSLRLGRQQIAFDLQRFTSVRDGPNVRQSYDAVWGHYERGLWHFSAFHSQPVHTVGIHAFDDYSSHRLTYGGLRAERMVFGSGYVSVYVSRFTQDGARFLTVSGNERREILDLHFSHTGGGFDSDVEVMGQTGQIARDDIRAWAAGSLGGYTFGTIGWTPRVGLQVDAASGDGNPRGHTLGTFNPLFPNGSYLTLASYSGYVNFIHVKPSVTLHPATPIKLMFAAAGQWRETTADAVYSQPNIPIRGTAGVPGLYTGTYGQIRVDWAVTRDASVALEAVHFAVADAIRRAGGRTSDYLGAEIKYGW
jgi:Alginate export